MFAARLLSPLVRLPFLFRARLRLLPFFLFLLLPFFVFEVTVLLALFLLRIHDLHLSWAGFGIRWSASLCQK